MTSFASMTELDAAIPLSAIEEELFALLSNVVRYQNRETTLRVAGGWVRDKLLGVESHDIDIALNDQSGIEFANSVNAYLESLGMETRTVALIQANPDQSKHLETANLQVLGIDIDFVHLRAETYTETRIPEIRIGSEMEDALRRDFTINALFYNINHRCLEDLTGRGVSDLQRGLLVTPMSPLSTFRDDPLRVLRAVRFASRLLFSLDMDLVAAARSPSVLWALRTKVSKERVNKEAEGMLLHVSARPAVAAVLLLSLELLDPLLGLSSYLTPSSQPSEDDQPVMIETVSGYRLQAHCHRLASPWFEPSQRHLTYDQPIAAAEVDVTIVDGTAEPPSFQLVSSSSKWQRVGVEALCWLRAIRANNISFPFGAIHRQQDSITIFVEELMQPFSSPDSRPVFWAALLLAAGQMPLFDRKGKIVPIASTVLKEQLKIDNGTARATQQLLDGVYGLLDIMDLLPDDGEGIVVPLDPLADWLRLVVKERWLEALQLSAAFLLALSVLYPVGENVSSAGDSMEVDDVAAVAETIGPISQPLKEEDHSHQPLQLDLSTLLRPAVFGPVQMTILRRLQRVVTSIEAHGLHNAWEIKPLVDGSQLIQRLSLPKGPIVGRIIEEQIKWQLRHSGSRDVDVMLVHLAAWLQQQQQT